MIILSLHWWVWFSKITSRSSFSVILIHFNSKFYFSPPSSRSQRSCWGFVSRWGCWFWHAGCRSKAWLYRVRTKPQVKSWWLSVSHPGLSVNSVLHVLLTIPRFSQYSIKTSVELTSVQILVQCWQMLTTVYFKGPISCKTLFWPFRYCTIITTPHYKQPELEFGGRLSWGWKIFIKEKSFLEFPLFASISSVK